MKELWIALHRSPEGGADTIGERIVYEIQRLVVYPSEYWYWQRYGALFLAILEVQHDRIGAQELRDLGALSVLAHLIKLILEIDTSGEHLHAGLTFVHLGVLDHAG